MITAPVYYTEYSVLGGDTGAYFFEVDPTYWSGVPFLTQDYFAADPGYDGACDNPSYNRLRLPYQGTFSTTTEHAATYDAGVAVLGLGVSTTSGYSTAVSVSGENVDSEYYHYVCGGTYSVGTAPVIYAGP